MSPNSAYKLIPIVDGVDYSPAPQTMPELDPNTGLATGKTVKNGWSAPIYALLCTASNGNTTTIQIQALGDGSPTTFYSKAFVPGVVYYMYVSKVIGTNASFIGYQYQSAPLTL